MAIAAFGPGTIVVTRTDIANQTPINIGFANEFSLDFTSDMKELYGQNQFALEVAVGTKKATGKMKAAKISGFALNAAVFGQSFSTGTLAWAQGETITVPANPGPYTAVAANGATFDKDLGLVYLATGLPLALTTGAPTVGQYKVDAAGNYTFAAADAGKALVSSYAYAVSASGQTLQVTNQPIGTTPTFQLDYCTLYNGRQFVFRFFKAVSNKLSMAFKLTDFVMPEIDFAFGADAAGRVVNAYFPEVS